MRRWIPFVLLGVVICAVTATGIGVRASYGARVTGDEPQYVLSALSLWEDGNLDISDEIADERYRDFHEAALPQQTEPLADGRQLSPHSPLLPIILAVPVGLGGWVGAKLVLAVFGGVLAAATAWIMHRRFAISTFVAIAVSAVVGSAAPLAVYSTQTYPAIVAALVTVLVVGALTRPEPRPWAAVAGVVSLPWLAIKFVPLAAILAFWALSTVSGVNRRRVFSTLALAGLATLGLNQWIYGGFTPYAVGDHFVGGEFTAVGTNVNLIGRATRLVGLIVDAGFGLASWQPLYLLAPLVVVWAWRRRPDMRWPLAAVVVSWLTATFVALTMHGWWFPGRQVVAILPLIAIAVGVWADGHRARVAGAIGVGSLGVFAFVNLVRQGLAGNVTWVVDFANTQDPMRRAMAALLPDYMVPSPRTWVLHVLWTAVALALAGIGWRSSRPTSAIATETLHPLATATGSMTHT